MTTLAPERTDELVTDLRRGLDLDGLGNPAGTLFADGYTEHEITMTNGIPFTDGTTQTNNSFWDPSCGGHCCIG